MTDNQRYYQVGGTVAAEAPSYVERQADKELYQAIQEGEYCIILDPRQMGKSSLVSRIRSKLDKNKFGYIPIDVTSFSTESEPDQWYYSLTNQIARSIDPEFKLSSWWDNPEYSRLPPLDRFKTFIESVLLTLVQGDKRIAIVIDEIDSVLSLKRFRADDFFVLIRSFYNRREDPVYSRLIFVLIGVAAPSDLIADKTRTPFNIGRTIELQGFQLAETAPLQEGLRSSLVGDPKAVLREILWWTGGQPFLTQKLCSLTRANRLSIPKGHEAVEIEKLVQSKVITQWEKNDDPVHFTTIRDRILQSKQPTSRLLDLWSQTLKDGGIKIDKSSLEQEELRLTGLVVRQNGMFRPANRIYCEIFNKPLIQSILAALRPYEEAISAWRRSGYTDISRLLRGNALQEALKWSSDLQNANIDPEDQRFLESSLALEKVEHLSDNEPQVANLLKQFLPQLLTITSHPLVIIQEIQAWAGTQPDLIEPVCQLIVGANADHPISENKETEWVGKLIQTHLIQDWENQTASDHLKFVSDSILGSENWRELLLCLQKILQQNNTEATDDTPEFSTLLKLGLVKNQDGIKHISNHTYANVFNLAWIEKELAKKRFFMHGRYEIIRELKKKDGVQVYLVQDLVGKEYVVKQLSPVFSNTADYEEAKHILLDKLRDFRRISSSLIPDTFPFFEDGNFYIFQEKIGGNNLDEEIIPGEPWDEDKVVSLLIEILNVLILIHQGNLAHLNLKPANLRRRQDGRIVPIDFGFLKEITLTSNSEQAIQPERIGTLGYIPLKKTGDWSKESLDIYAVGMIGIQALTGRDPKRLPRDRTDLEKGRIIWRFETSNVKMTKVSDELARILTKMVCHEPSKRYPDVSSIHQELKELQSKRRPFYAWLTDRRVLAAGVIGLLLMNTISFLWYERSLKNQNINQSSSLVESQRNRLIEECSKIVQSGGYDNGRLMRVDVVIEAEKVRDACHQLNSSQKNTNHLQFLKNEGIAALLLSQSALQLDQKKNAKSYLENSESSFQKAININKNDPQSHFYLGLIKQSQGNGGYRGNYQAAIKHYLEPNQDLQKEDYYILAKLASVSERLGDLETAIKLYEKAIGAKPPTVSSDHLANLRYNQLTLSDRVDGKYITLEKTREYSNLVTKLKPGHKANNEYANRCFGDAERGAPDRCSALRQLNPVYSCKDYPVIAIVEPDKSRIKSFCEF